MIKEVPLSKPPRGGRRKGAGRPSLVRENNARIAQGLEPFATPQKKEKSKAQLPVATKLRRQEILAEMLSIRSEHIVKRVLDKAMDDSDKDQMECIKIVMDRILPKDYIAKSGNRSGAIQINISGIGQVDPVVQEVYEADVEEINDDN